MKKQDMQKDWLTANHDKVLLRFIFIKFVQMKVFASVALGLLVGIVTSLIWLLYENQLKALKERSKLMFTLLIGALIAGCLLIAFIENYADQVTFTPITLTYPILVGKEVSAPAGRITYGYALLLTTTIIIAPIFFDLFESVGKRNSGTEVSKYQTEIMPRPVELSMLCVLLLYSYKSYIDGYWDSFEIGRTFANIGGLCTFFAFFTSSLLRTDIRPTIRVVSRIIIYTLCYVSIVLVMLA